MASKRERPQDIKKLMQEQMKSKAVTKQIDSPHAKYPLCQKISLVIVIVHQGFHKCLLYICQCEYYLLKQFSSFCIPVLVRTYSVLPYVLPYWPGASWRSG